MGNSGGEGAMSTSNPSAAGTAGGSAFMFDKGDELLVEADEIPALVRSAFESDNSAGGLDGGGAQPARATDQLLASLRHIVAVKENEVAEITKCHYEDFVRSVDELRMVKRYSTELRRQVQNFNSTLSASGEMLYNTMEHAASLHRCARCTFTIGLLPTAKMVKYAHYSSFRADVPDDTSARIRIRPRGLVRAEQARESRTRSMCSGRPSRSHRLS